MRVQAPKLPPVKYSTTRLGGGVTAQGNPYPGGLDLTTPALNLLPGVCRDALNFECLQNGGYGRIAGYERFDGRSRPSDATFQVIQVTSFTNVPAAGASITQASSGATGTVAAVYNSGGVYYMVVTKIAGAFDTAGAITSGATPIGTATTTTVQLTALENAQYTVAAADIYRADIQAVPGSGPMLGVVAMVFSGVDYVYAFRANSGGTAVDIYKSSSSGWVNVPLYKIVEFTAGGTATPADGATLTQGGVTATVKRVMTRSGPSWTGSAAGAFVITTPSGGNFAAGAATLSGGATVTLSGAQTAITLLPNGRFEFAKGNFSGQASSRRIYGCDGVNKAFEFDGDVLAPITTGLSPDAPTHIAVHKNFLFVALESSISHCGAGTPFLWGAADGGGEIATGDTVSGMLTLPGAQTTATLGVWMRTTTGMLYGIDPDTFNFVNYDGGTGALPYSLQNLSDTFGFADLGVVNLQTSLNFGNFRSSTLTKNIMPFVVQQRTKLVASTINRTKGQYRVFFNDGYGLWITMLNQQYLGAMPVLFPNPVSCIDQDDDSDGAEVTYFGSSDSNGYVYQLDAGPSFDGDDLTAYITLAWDFLKSSQVIKVFRGATVEMSGDAYAAISFGYRLGYGTSLIGQPTDVSYSSSFASVFWDEFTWDSFYWDGQTIMPTYADMTGSAENVQTTIRSTTDYIEPFQLNSITYRYSIRRGMRGSL